MKLKFLKDTYYNDKLFASAGEVKEVSEELGFAARWLKSGAIEVKEEVVSKVEVVVDPKLDALSAEVVEEVKQEVIAEEEKAVDTKPSKKNKGPRVG